MYQEMTQSTEKPTEMPPTTAPGDIPMAPHVTGNVTETGRPVLRLPHPVSGPIEPPPARPGQGVIPSGRSGVASRPIRRLTPSRSRMAATAASRQQRAVPASWSVVHVLDRMEEAYEVLSRLPMNTRPRAFSNSMPAYAYERSDRVAQVETGELERLMKLQNRVRFGVRADQVERMEEALAWCMQYLGDSAEVARAVQLGALWAAMRLDAGKRLKKMKINGRMFNRRKVHGLKVIATELIRRQVQVR
jgi:hypothetical protein